jgi:hypothetical protein
MYIPLFFVVRSNVSDYANMLISLSRMTPPICFKQYLDGNKYTDSNKGRVARKRMSTL